MTGEVSISLTERQDEFARALVRQGRYSSLSAVVQQGLDLLRRKIEAEEIALRALMEERRAGPFVSAREMERRVAELLERKRLEHCPQD